MYKVEIFNNGDYSFKVKSKDYEFLVDIKDKGISPPDTLLAGLGSCIGVYIRKYIEGAKLELNKFSVQVQAEFSKIPPISFRQINVAIDLGVNKLDEHRREALLRFIKNCPVHNTLKNNPDINVKII